MTPSVEPTTEIPPQMPPARGNCDLLMLAVAAAFSVPAAEIRAASRRSPKVAFARQCAMYLAHVVFSLTLTDVGLAFGRDRTTAAHACALVESRREQPEIEALLDSLERVCVSLSLRVANEAPR